MIVFSDFDGTLRRGNEQVFMRNLMAIEDFRKLGNQFCISTGRSLLSLERIFPNWREYADFVILNNGAECVDNKGKEIFEVTFSLDVARRICGAVLGVEAFDEPMPIFYENGLEKQDLSGEVSKIRFWSKMSEVSAGIVEFCEKNFSDLVKAYPEYGVLPADVDLVKAGVTSFVDVVPIEAGKELAMKHLLDYLGIANESEATVVGDGLNDVSALKKYNGYAIADGNEAAVAAVGAGHVVENVADLMELLSEK